MAFWNSRIQRIEKQHGVKTEDHCRNGTHDGKSMYDSNFLKIGPIPPEFIEGMTRDEATKIGFRYEGVLYFQYYLLDGIYDTDEYGVQAKLGDSFKGEARRNILRIKRFFEGYDRRAAVRQAKTDARNKAEYTRRHPERAEEARKSKGKAPPPEPVHVIPFGELERKEKARKAKAQAEHDELNRRARENLRANDRTIARRERDAGMSRGIQKGVKQW